MYKKQHMMEPKAQRWRAIVVFRDHTDGLLVLGANYSMVREKYQEPWFEMYDDEQRGWAREIRVQKWQGAADYGHWETQGILPIPVPLN